MQVETEDMILFWQKDSIFSNWYDIRTMYGIHMCMMGPEEYTEVSGRWIKPGTEDNPSQDVDWCFRNSEAAFMYNKAVVFEDHLVISYLLHRQDTYSHPKDVKALGRTIKGFDEKIWALHREDAMYRAVYGKFSSVTELKQRLLDTGDKILVEASPVDNIWGIGLAPNDPLALDKKNWKGLNLLGEALMKARTKLREEQKERE